LSDPDFSPEFPPIAEIVPHTGNMILLERVLEHAGDATVCAVAIDAQTLFVQGDGAVGSWVGIEYMAQCVAAHAGLLARAMGKEPRVGYLVSSRRLRFHAPRFVPGQELRISAAQLWGGQQGMVSFQCKVEDVSSGALLVEGRLNCYLPETP
jgi:predicted hotdog family 3-hydroxylacyl-ACP dehydratase